MRISLFWMTLLLLIFASPGRGQMPLVSSVEPEAGRAGDLFTARGSNLGADCVAAVYLTDGKTDTKLVIVEQSAAMLKFKIPSDVKPGRLALMVLTPGPSAKLIEEPVKITIEPET